jgi:hypothetical protein
MTAAVLAAAADLAGCRNTGVLDRWAATNCLCAAAGLERGGKATKLGTAYV